MMAGPTRNPVPAATIDEAARWLAVGDTLSAEEQAARDAWLAADPRHARAYAEMRDVWAHMGGVPETPSLRSSLPPPDRRSRRSARHAIAPPRPRRIGPALAASLALVVIGVAQDWPTRLRADAMTATGERRVVRLPDGSTAHLDTHSALAVDFTGDRRVVRLLTGGAAFAVARDPARPFTVETGGGSATALGTRFLVRREDDGACVTVTEHKVRVAYAFPRVHAAIVAEGQSVAYGPNGLGRPTAADTAAAMAWTEGVLVFRDRPLAEVVAAIGRYHRGYVGVVGDARMLRVGGVFRIDDPVAALDQLQRSLGLRSVRLTDRLILISG